MKRILSAAVLSSAFVGMSAPAFAAVDCRMIFDAGSSGTRLYVYEKQGAGWVEHEGPKVSALADPIRGIRGKAWRDAPAVMAEVLRSLEDMRADGPMDKGKPKWQAFDWKSQCNLKSASIYATAGMRIAEQERLDGATKFWGGMLPLLKNRLPAGTVVQTRTLTGFEEGLYSWLSLNAKGKGDDFGMVEMGGASAQVTFPCPDCQDGKPVLINGKTINMFSYSFLGLGIDEAAVVLGGEGLKTPTSACAFGVGKDNPNWKVESCSSTIKLSSAEGIVDPYNMSAKGKGTVKKLPPQTAKVPRWVATGGFSFSTDNDVQDFCVNAKPGFQSEMSCFRATYFGKLLKEIGVEKPEKSNSSWTLGAVICEENACLSKAPTRECHWMKDRCLVN